MWEMSLLADLILKNEARFCSTDDDILSQSIVSDSPQIIWLLVPQFPGFGLSEARIWELLDFDERILIYKELSIGILLD
jgi:hypothetical protein